MKLISNQIKSTTKEFLSNYISIPFLAWLILPLVLMDTFVSSLCLNISVYFTKVRHFEPFLIGETVSLYYVGSFIGSLIGGSLTLKYSSLKIASISSILLGIGFLSLLNTHDVFQLKIMMLCIGLLTNLLSTSNLSSFIRTAKNDPSMKLKLINLELAIFNLSFSISAYVLISLGVEQIDYVLIFTSTCLCVLGVFAYCIKNLNVFSPPQNFNNSRLCKPKNYKILLGILLSVILVGLIFSMIKVIYAPTIENRFGDNGVSVLVASINPWIIFLLQPFLVNRLKNKDNIIVMGFGVFIIGTGYLFFGLSSSFWMTVFSLIFLTMGEMLYSPISKSIIISLFEHGREGFALGLWRALFLGSGFIGPIFSGWAAQKYGNMMVWEICGILGLSGLLLCLIMSQSYRYSVELNRLNSATTN
ncbi:MFS transporter [Legionella pneumophila]|uniref:MFS transporter n=1 Tax=Legionella pneumophila TaxID=446 RepID=UPI00034C7F4D|nr:MFS transporter [Legionella pneumophila]MCW8442358.1 MFS transporter [Legionella pneumophila]